MHGRTRHFNPEINIIDVLYSSVSKWGGDILYFCHWDKVLGGFGLIVSVTLPNHITSIITLATTLTHTHTHTQIFIPTYSHTHTHTNTRIFIHLGATSKKWKFRVVHIVQGVH